MKTHDDLDDLKAAFDAATPAPDPARKADTLRLARENFDRHQGSANPARLSSVTAPRGFMTGVKRMFATLTGKRALTLTTAIVACGLVVLTPAGRDLLNLPARGPIMADRGPTADQPQVTPRPADTVAPPAEEPAIAPVTDTLADTLVAPTTPPRAEAELLQNRVPAAPTPSPQAGVETRAPLGLNAVANPQDARVAPPPNTETFANEDPNPLKVTAREPVSTFSIDVDTAAYSVVRNSLERGALPPPQAVRIEEMINYFPYDYPAPEPGAAPFEPSVNVFETPWNAETQLVHIGIQGTLPALDDRPPLNLVFLIDTSGSMESPDKLPLLVQSFRLMLSELHPEDEVAIVTYAGSAGRVLDPTPASEPVTILAALGDLTAGGSTNGQSGLDQAYATAAWMAAEGEVSRVILATDGDFNVGLSDPEALEDFIAEERDSGTYLSVLGFGRGNLDDATMQALAQTGNGTAAYIDTLAEAQKVLVDQLSGALFSIADDVKVQVEWNPAAVAEYRLIGYETRALRREDFNNDAVDAGELGAGHSVTALYEITPVGSAARLTDPLRYGETAETGAAPTDELGFLSLRYKSPGDEASRLIETPIAMDLAADADTSFVAAIAGFGELLRGSDYLGDWGYAEAIDLANSARGEDPFGYRTEAVRLMRLAQSLAR